MSLRLAISWLTALGLAVPAGAIPPPLPPPTFHYYGPVRLCPPGPSPFYSIDVLEGEAGNIQESRLGVSQERGGLGIAHISGQAISRILPDDAVPIGTVNVRDAGTLQRIRTSDGKIRYRIATSENRYADRLEIAATAFDGTERDLEIIGRIRFGAEARAACANVPETLVATPEGHDERAIWLSPKRHRGPLTLCWAGVALDVRGSEFVLLPWYRHFAMAMIEDGTQQVAIAAGLHPAGSPLAWTGFSSAVVDDSRFTADLSEPASGWPSVLLLPGSSASRVRVMTRADRERYGPNGGSHVTFSFSRAPSEADRAAFVRRLRGQTPNDHCFDPDRQ